MWRSTERLLRAMHYERINGYLVSDHSGRAARLQQSPSSEPTQPRRMILTERGNYGI